MKKLFLLLFLLVFNANFACAGENYTVLKTISKNSPIRVDADANSKRFSHIQKGIELYSNDDKQKGDFYEIDLNLEKPYFIEKKYVKIEKNVSFIEPCKVKDITLKENREFFILKIKFENVPPYQTAETFEGLDLNVFNLNFSDIKGFKGHNNFKITENENCSITIKYISKFPLVGYGIEKKGDSIVLKIRKLPKIYETAPLKGIKIALDAGHGGNETGVCANGLKEKDVNLQIVKKLKRELEQNGAKVYLTRKDDEDMGLYERVDFAKRKNAMFLLSIHQNSLPDPKKYDKKHGAGVYYYNKQSKNLAQEIQTQLLEATNFKDDGVNYASFALNRPTEMLCVLIECGYLIHPYEAKMLSNEECQKKIAKAIRIGVEYSLRNMLGD